MKFVQEPKLNAGFPTLDELLFNGGFKRGELCIFVCMPLGQHKSRLCLNLEAKEQLKTEANIEIME